jgi:DNA gyrase/topoisomerase IV subunit A
MDMKDGDYIEHLFVCSTHDYLLFFTNRGKVYRSKVYELPGGPRTAKGRYLGNVLPLREGERVQSVLATRDFAETQYLVFAPAPASSRRPSSRRTTRRSRPTASSRSTSARTTSSWPSGASIPRRRS